MIPSTTSSAVVLTRISQSLMGQFFSDILSSTIEKIMILPWMHIRDSFIISLVLYLSNDKQRTMHRRSFSQTFPRRHHRSSNRHAVLFLGSQKKNVSNAMVFSHVSTLIKQIVWCHLVCSAHQNGVISVGPWCYRFRKTASEGAANALVLPVATIQALHPFVFCV